MSVFEITIRPKVEDAWPVVARYQPETGALTQWSWGKLHLDLDKLSLLLPKDKKYGLRIGKALFRQQVLEDDEETIQEDILGAFGKAVDQASRDEPLRVLLIVEDDALREVHWGQLCAPLGSKWDYLLPNQSTPFSLYLPSQIPHSYPPIGSRDLSALLLVAGPEDLEGDYGLASFDVKETVTNIQDALGEIPCEVLAAVKNAKGPPSLDGLCSLLTSARPTLLHIVCHGAYRREAGETVLYFPSEEGRPVPASTLLERLSRLDPLPRLTFLSTCESADPQAESGLGGLGQRLVRDLGMPAVVAMTYQITIVTAEALASAFYARLREHGEVDRALCEGLSGLQGRHDFTVPALFSRLGERALWSEALDRPLDEEDIGYGLERMGSLLEERAPVLRTEFEDLANTIRTSLSAETRQEREAALAAVTQLCSRALDLTFNALAFGEKPPDYDGRCPFPGLSAFGARFLTSGEKEEDDREFFFGRAPLVKRLKIKLGGHNFLPVLGASGSGKSSLVLAGLAPALQKAEPGLRVVYLRPGSDPGTQLEASLDAGLAGAGDQPLLLVVDQFEELFTLTRDDGQRRAFIDRLLALAGEHRVVLTMRADFLGDCAPYENLRRQIQDHQELIAPMTTAELRSALEQQADAVGLHFEAGLGHQVFEDVQGQPGAMPLLQHAMLQLWNQRSGRELRWQEYQAFGGIQGAITHTADQVYDGLSEPAQNRMRNLLLRLVHLDDASDQLRLTPRRVPLSELVPAGKDPAETRALVERLADQKLRLLVTSVNEATGQAEVEVAHAVLIQHWPRLKDWLDPEVARLRQELGQAAREWRKNHRDESYLVHQGRRLERAVDLASRRTVELSALRQEYVEACIMLQERSSLVEARIRIFDRHESEGPGYPVELSVPGWGEPQRGQIFDDVKFIGGGTFLVGRESYFPWDDRYGRMLGEQFFADKATGQAYRNLLTAVHRQGGKLQVRLRIDPPELQALAWESMHHPVDEDWYELAVSAGTPFSRQVPIQDREPAQPLAVRPLRVLAIVASPSDLERYGLVHLDAQSLHKVLDGVPDRWVTTYLETGTPEPPTLANVRQALAEGYHLVHFLCHAREVDQGTFLFLEGEDGRVQAVGESELIPVFSALRQPPLLCFLAADETEGLVLGLLKKTSVQAVIAPTRPWSLDTYVRFTEQSYSRLFAHGMVDLAMNEARAIVLDRPDWFTPALFSKLPRNRLIASSGSGLPTRMEALEENEAYIRVFSPLGEKAGYPVELSIPNRREFPRGRMHLDFGRLVKERDPRECGRILGAALFDPDAIGDAFREAAAGVSSTDGRLRLRLRLDPLELHALSWERLLHPFEGQWHPLSATTNTPFSRYIPIQRFEAPRPLTERPLRLLAIIAWPPDLEDYGMAAIDREELEALQAVLDGLPGIEITYLQTGTADPPTLNRILQEMLSREYHLLHCLCHSLQVDRSPRGVLFLEDEEDNVDTVAADRLVRVFRATEATPRFCFFSTAESAKPLGKLPGSIATGPIAMQLVGRTGVQAAVAMTGRVGLAAASDLVEHFYHRLLAHGQVDLALNEARASLLKEKADWDWGIPVLFSRLPRNQLLAL